jgi:16S rRNA (cytosine967-C5)-methyltransferase
VTPAARLQAAIQILDTVASSNTPVDRAVKAWGKANRYAGSGDRRAVSERVYQCIRDKGRLGGGDGRALVLASLRFVDGLAPEDIEARFGSDPHGPAALTDSERAALEQAPAAEALGLPDFIEDELRATFGHDWRDEAEALLRGRAPLDVRVNAAKATVGQAMATLPRCAPTPFSALGLRFEGSPDLTASPAFEAGLFEVQDEGSQIAAFLAGSGAAGLVVDYCAGGGGKTLALAANASRLVACDVDTRRLDAIKPRLKRAGASAELRKLGPEGEGVEDLAGQADLVLVDAPCSASGTWRRRPEAAWRLNPGEIARLHALQVAILSRAAALVKPGGRLAYVTCSVLDAENGAVVRGFCEAHGDFRPLPIDTAAQTHTLTDAARERLAALSGGGHTVQMSPRRTGADGFFVALFERSA